MPMTSMFFFGPNDRKNVDDFRPSVHDSDGLSVANGRGEELWRQLHNPTDLQISAFADLNPHGFGLMQRQRNFLAYQDLESSFERRPSLWAEPIGDWGEGSVKLIEIPTKEEVHDNIACFWQPKTALQAKGEHTYTYRLHWGPDAPRPLQLARFSRTGIGARGDNAALFVLDLTGDRLKSVDPKILRGVVTAEKAKVQNIVTQPNPATGGWRLSFELLKEKNPVEIRASLMQEAEPVSEVCISMDTLGQVRGSFQPSDPPLNQFLPREAPMEMAVQLLRSVQPHVQASKFVRAWPRRACIFAATILLTLAGCYEMYQVLQVGGVTILEWTILVLFVALFAWIAFSFTSAIAGFLVLLFRRKDELGISAGNRKPDRNAAAHLQ